MKVNILDNDIVWRELDGEVVILNLATGEYYGLEGAANAMWRALVEHGTTERVVDAIAAEYDAPVDRIAADLDRLVADLAQRRIVQVDAPHAG